ncbi:hypothetical protein D3C74_378890 [compost metagenome]
MFFKCLEKLIRQILAIVAYTDIPGLMVNTRTYDINLFLLKSKCFRNLTVPALHPMTETDCSYATILIAGPC